MDNLTIYGFEKSTNLISKLDQVTYDMIGYEETNYFDVTKPANDDSHYVISFFTDCELVKMMLASKESLLETISNGIQEVWGNIDDMLDA